jgi:hypothetical protein
MNRKKFSDLFIENVSVGRSWKFWKYQLIEPIFTGKFEFTSRFMSFESTKRSTIQKSAVCGSKIWPHGSPESKCTSSFHSWDLFVEVVEKKICFEQTVFVQQSHFFFYQALEWFFQPHLRPYCETNINRSPSILCKKFCILPATLHSRRGNESRCVVAWENHCQRGCKKHPTPSRRNERNKRFITFQ